MYFHALSHFHNYYYEVYYYYSHLSRKVAYLIICTLIYLEGYVINQKKILMILYFRLPDISKIQAKGKSYPQNRNILFLKLFITNSVPLVIKRLRTGSNI